jgi:hypothetical protein
MKCGTDILCHKGKEKESKEEEEEEDLCDDGRVPDTVDVLISGSV